MATSEKFWVLQHDCLTRMLKFELLNNNVLQAVGEPCSREISIPMGGLFSAQSADLHTRWGVKKGEETEGLAPSVFQKMGTCIGAEALCGSAGHSSATTCCWLFQEVCDLLSEIWKLEVLCHCVDSGAATCVGKCLKQSRLALGVHMTAGGGHSCTSAHPSTLTDTWDLRYGAPLISPSRAAREYLPCILISSLTGTLPWQVTWASQILSALSWAQLAMLSGYRRMTVMRALHKVVRRVHAASPWWPENTLHAVYNVGHDLPCPRNTATAKLLHWLVGNAVWSGHQYTEREIPTEFQLEGYTPAWCDDITILRSIAAEL